MDIDLDRWQALLAAYRNADDSSPPFMLLQEAHGRASRARSDLEAFEARGAVGRRDQRHPDMQASFQRGVDELKARLAEVEAEVRRVELLSKACAAKRWALHALVESCRGWARSQSPPVVLPGDGDANTITGMSGFAKSSTRIATPPGREPFGTSSVRG